MAMEQLTFSKWEDNQGDSVANEWFLYFFSTCLFCSTWAAPIIIWQWSEVQKWKLKICHCHGWQATLFEAEFECLGGMLILLNTNVRLINPLPLAVSSARLSISHTLTSPFLSLLLILSKDVWNQWSQPYSLIWIIEYSSAYCVATRHPYSRQPEHWDVVCSQRKTDVLCHVCNDRQKSAFRVPAFIIVNVDDTGLLPSL